MTASMLDVGGRVVGRHAELEQLSAALEDAARQGGEFVLIGGEPGVGKSTLIQVFGELVVARDGVFGYGRYREGAPTPYLALSEALGAFVADMDAMPRAERDRWRADLRRALDSPGAVHALRALVPGLAVVLGDETESVALDAADGRHRLQRAVVRLVSTTATYRPVVLAVDDLQWADQDSLLLFRELLGASIRNVVLVGAHRTGEFDPAASGVWPGAGRPIVLAPLTAGDIEVLLTDVSGHAAGLHDVAVEFYRRTAGNPLHIRQLLSRARQAGAVSRPAHGGQPIWNLGVLESIEIAADIAEFLGRAIDRLSPSEAEVLSALACIGHEFDLADAEVAAAQPAELVARALWTALDLRLLDTVDPDGRRVVPVIDREVRYRFSHDRVAEVAQARLTAEERRAVHLRLGRSLAVHGDARLFDAARHLGIGGLALAPGATRVEFARVERQAAEQARAQASFPMALECFRAGLALLGEHRWAEHPVLARVLHLGAAEAAYLVADAPLLATLLDDAHAVLSDPADRAHLAFLRLKGQVAQHRLQEALDTGLHALDEIGESLPPHPGRSQVVSKVLRTRVRMRGWSDERFLLLHHCRDRRTIEVQRILSELRNISYIVRPDLFPLVVVKQLELTVTRGLVPSSPVAMASFGVLLVVSGDYVNSQRFGELGLLLAERAGFQQAGPETRFLYHDFICPWRHSMREGVLPLQAAFHEALALGDPESAGWIAAVLMYQTFMAGHPLPEIDALARSLVHEIRSHRTTSTLCRATQQMVLNLMGRSDDPFLLAGESGYDEREVLPEARRSNDVVALSGAAVQKLILHFWCGDDAGGLPFADETARYLAGLSGTPNVQLYHLINALIRIRAAPGDRATARAVRRSLALHRKWAAVAPANYAAPSELIQGVWERAQGDLRGAERHLGRAIELAERHRLPQISGLAYEEAGALHGQAGRVSMSRDMIRTAHQRWLGLGMAVRSDRLERTYPWLLSRDVVRSDSAMVDPVGVHRLIQALPAASTFDRLADVLLGAVASITGAARVLLVDSEPGRMAIQAVHASGTTTVGGSASEAGFDHGLVQEAARSGGPAVRGDGDKVHHSERAAVAVPVVLRGRTVAVVYAELDDQAQVLGLTHYEALAALCAQAAAPLWNFELEGRLQDAEEQRRSLIDVQSRFIPSELLRILDIDDIRRVRRGHRVERRVTVLISDIRGYTGMVESMDVAEASELVLGFLGAVEVPIITSNGLLQDVRGDEILAVFDTQPDDAVRAGLAILRSLREHNRERVARGADELRVGIGINTGTVALGLVGGVNRMALTVIGDAVNLASRIENTTKRYGSNLLISDDTHAELVDPDRFAVRRMERTLVVNRRRPVTIYEVYDDDPEPLRTAKQAAQPAFDEAFGLLDAGDIDQARMAFELCRDLLPDDPVAPLHLAHCAALARLESGGGQEIVLLHR